MSDKETTKNLLKNNTCENCLYVSYLEDQIHYCVLDEIYGPQFATPDLNSCKYWSKR